MREVIILNHDAAEDYRQRHAAFYQSLTYEQRLHAFAVQAARLILIGIRSGPYYQEHLPLELIVADLGTEAGRREAECRLYAMPEPEHKIARLAHKAVLAALNVDSRAGAIEGAALFAEYHNLPRPDEVGWDTVPDWEPAYTFWEMVQEAVNSEGASH